MPDFQQDYEDEETENVSPREGLEKKSLGKSSDKGTGMDNVKDSEDEVNESENSFTEIDESEKGLCEETVNGGQEKCVYYGRLGTACLCSGCCPDEDEDMDSTSWIPHSSFSESSSVHTENWSEESFMKRLKKDLPDDARDSKSESKHSCEEDYKEDKFREYESENKPQADESENKSEEDESQNKSEEEESENESEEEESESKSEEDESENKSEEAECFSEDADKDEPKEAVSEGKSDNSENDSGVLDNVQAGNQSEHDQNEETSSDGSEQSLNEDTRKEAEEDSSDDDGSYDSDKDAKVLLSFPVPVSICLDKLRLTASEMDILLNNSTSTTAQNGQNGSSKYASFEQKKQ